MRSTALPVRLRISLAGGASFCAQPTFDCHLHRPSCRCPARQWWSHRHIRCRPGAGLQVSGFRLQVSGFRLQASGFRLQVSGFRLQASGFRLQASGFRFQVSGFRFQASGFRFQASGFRLQVSGFRFQASGFRLQASGFRFQVSGFRLQASGFRLQVSPSSKVSLSSPSLTGFSGSLTSVGWGCGFQLPELTSCCFFLVTGPVSFHWGVPAPACAGALDNPRVASNTRKIRRSILGTVFP